MDLRTFSLTPQDNKNQWRNWTHYLVQLYYDIVSLQDYLDYFNPDYRLVNASEWPSTMFYYDWVNIMSDEDLYTYNYKMPAWRLQWNNEIITTQEAKDEYIKNNIVFTLKNMDEINEEFTKLDNPPKIVISRPSKGLFYYIEDENIYIDYQNISDELLEGQAIESYLYFTIYFPAYLNFHQGLKTTDPRSLLWFGTLETMKELEPYFKVYYNEEGNWGIFDAYTYDMLLSTHPELQEFSSFATIYSMLMTESGYNNASNPEKWDINKYFVISQQFPSLYMFSSVNENIVAEYQSTADLIVTTRLNLNFSSIMRYENFNCDLNDPQGRTDGNQYWPVGSEENGKHGLNTAKLQSYDVIGEGRYQDYIRNTANEVWTNQTPLMHTLYMINQTNNYKERFITDEVWSSGVDSAGDVVNNGYLKYSLKLYIRDIPDDNPDNEMTFYDTYKVLIQIR